MIMIGGEKNLDAPSSGRFVGPASSRVHHLPVRVYFEDTDHSGLVYHANYLRYFERARSDMLRLAGIDQRATFEGGKGVYTVADMHIRYFRPALYDDALVVVSRITDIRAASIVIQQTVIRPDERLSDERLTEATVHAAFISSNGRPIRQPADWVARFTPFLETLA
jgi:acyl-CoA thioester hydrolase